MLIVLVAVLGLVLILRGPSMLPRIGEALGRTVKDARTEIPSALKGDPGEPGDSSASGASGGTGGPDKPTGA